MSNRIKKILVTGGTGYIGSSLVKKLYRLGYDVYIITRCNSNLDLICEIQEYIKIYSFNGDSQNLCNIMSSIKPDTVIHVASLFSVNHTTSELKGLIDSNILFSTQVLESAVKSDVKYFINTGTHWQNYRNQKYNPVNLYSATKKAFEVISKYYAETSDIRIINLKLIDTYGPFDTRPKVINLLKKVYVNDEQLDMSDGQQELGLLYIEDVLNAYLIAMEKIQMMESKNIVDFLALPSEICTLKEVVNIFEDVVGKKLNIAWGKRPYRDREMMKVYTLEKNILEGEKRVSLSEGIKNIIEIENIDIK